MSNKVKLDRLIQGLSQIQLAKLTGLSPGALSLIERELVEARPETKEIISKALKRPIQEIFPEDKGLN